MKRRSFLQLLGISPVTAALPSAAEKFAERAKALDPRPAEPYVPLYSTSDKGAPDDPDCGCTVTCGSITSFAQIPPRRR